MRVLDHIVFSPTEPSSREVLWAKPMGGGFAFYLFDGTWKPMKVVDDKGTPSTDDDTPYDPGSGEQLGPDTVGSREIINRSIMTEDLSKEVTDKLDDIYVQDIESLFINGTKPE